MSTAKLQKIRRAWRDTTGHLYCSPVGWMSDDELDAIALRLPKRITANLVAQRLIIADALLNPEDLK